jgi:hypothetical protein
MCASRAYPLHLHVAADGESLGNVVVGRREIDHETS